MLRPTNRFVPPKEARRAIDMENRQNHSGQNNAETANGGGLFLNSSTPFYGQAQGKICKDQDN
jgi:hypothetical protein